MLQHHQPKHDPERLWVDKLEPKVAALRAELVRQPPGDVARRSGATLDGLLLRLTMLSEDLEVDTAGYVVSRPGGGELDSFLQSLVLTYLDTADGGPPAGRWVTFRDLPNGSFYNQAFQGYGPDRLAKRWKLDIAGFESACRAAGGLPIDVGDAGFSFAVLPRIDMAAVYWLGDEDFPSKASVLFDANAHFYMVVDGLAILGSRLVSRILAAGPPEADS
jgi:hypothetical protein